MVEVVQRQSIDAEVDGEFARINYFRIALNSIGTMREEICNACRPRCSLEGSPS